MNASEILDRATRRLAGAGQPTPRLDSEVLLCHVLGVTRTSLLLDPEQGVPMAAGEAFERAVDARARGCPVAYLTGRKEFFSLDLRVDPSVLIPRPETEHLVEEALRLARLRVNDGAAVVWAVDVGTGSGAIAVALAHEEPCVRVVALDRSGAALGVARENAAAHGVTDRIALLRSDLLDAFGGPAATGRFDLVLSNPPYVCDAEYARLPAGVREYEPEAALRCGPDRYRFHRRIARAAWTLLRPGGSVVFEIGGEAAVDEAEVSEVLEGFDETRRIRDLAGRLRVLSGRRMEGV